jgi:hemerythrin-like domain-containing protein
VNTTPTRALRDEHTIILEVLDRFEHALPHAARTTDAGSRRLAVFIEIFRGFADFCHHRKEEIGLFKLLERHGMGTAVACMLEEHHEGRALIAQLEDAVNLGDAAGFEAAGHGYVDLLRAHINKENHMLFEMADASLNAAEVAEFARLCDQIEAEPDYVKTLQHCRMLIESLLESEQ